MITTSYKMNNLAEYFHRSGQFYYILFDLKGYCKYVNPLFQKELVISVLIFVVTNLQIVLQKATMKNLKLLLKNACGIREMKSFVQI